MIYKTIEASAGAELIEKNSRFICILNPLSKEQDAAKVLHNTRKKYPGGRHYCYAYRLRQDGVLLERCSDDGEPGGTAGAPILNVLKGRDLVNVIAVVVRYFGGTLLGTGGLVKAYTAVVQSALHETAIAVMEYSQRIQVILDYCYLGGFENQLSRILNRLTGIYYNERVIVDAWIAVDQLPAFSARLDNLTGGKAVVKRFEEGFVPQR